MIILRCDAANMATTLLCKIPNVNPKMPALWSDIAINGKSTDYIDNNSLSLIMINIFNLDVSYSVKFKHT